MSLCGILSFIMKRYGIMLFLGAVLLSLSVCSKAAPAVQPQRSTVKQNQSGALPSNSVAGQQYTVQFDLNGIAGSVPKPQTIAAGQCAVQPQLRTAFREEPDGSASVLYWSSDRSGRERFRFAEPLNADTTLYAHFGSPRIYEIQGRAHISPLEDKQVKDVQGVITAITYSRKNPNGFFMQDIQGDGDTATSDGIYVYCGTDCPTGIAVQQHVSVTGTVKEYAYKPKNGPVEDMPLTQIALSELRIIENNSPLPAPIEITAADLEKPVFVDELNSLNPQSEAIDFYESLEGMRVCVRNPQIVAVPYKGTQYLAPSDAHGFSIRGGMMYNSYASTALLCLYPKKCFADTASINMPKPEPAIGDVYAGMVTGVLDYTYSKYQIALTDPLPALTRKAPGKESTPLISSIPFTPDKLNLVSYNLENFSKANTRQSHSSKKSAEERAAAFADQFVRLMQAPDLICLIEVQDDSGEKADDGVVSARDTLQLLTGEIEKHRAGLRYQTVVLNPEEGRDGGAPGANIRCAYLYRSDRLELVPDRDSNVSNSRATTKAEIEADGSRLLQNPARLGVGEAVFKNTRKSLVAHFRFKDGINGGKDFFVINNHFNSKRSDGKIWGRRQPVHRSSETKRHQQAELIASFISSITAVRPGAAVISVGDYNDFWFSKTIGIFKRAGMKNAIEALPENNRYTYVYDGHSQTLDNILVSDSVHIDMAEVLHVNAELPEKERLSDHDPVWVQVHW